MPAMDGSEARARFAAARIARLATADAAGRPHLVPVVFAVDGETVVTAVDRKPKRSPRLKRLANIAGNPAVSLLADSGYLEDWGALWWVRADGRARITTPAEDPQRWERAVVLLQARYPQYREQPPDGPLITVAVERWSGWRATAGG